jgi:hypothetical protein
MSIERNKALKVAQFANPSTRGNQTKAAIRLDSRRADYTKTLNDPANRGKDMSGYNRPGSMQGPR